MEDSSFNLDGNPFNLIKASYSTSVSDIAMLVEDAEFDGDHEVAQLHKAQQTLVTPVSRLPYELSWLPELSKSQIERALELVSEGNVSDVLAATDHFPELAKANISAHLLARNTETDTLVDQLCELWEVIDSSELAEFVNEERSKAGMPGVKVVQVEEALDNLRLSHAKSAATSIWRSSSPGHLMNKIVEAQLDDNPSGVFLNNLVREYDSRSESDLVRISQSIDDHINEARKADGGLAHAVSALSELLDRWDDVNQPVQLFEQSRGHEEGRSKQVYQRIRSLCLELANDHGRYSEALRLSQALLRTFPELESVADSLRKDVSDLEDLADQEEIQNVIQPLVDACEAAKKNPMRLRNDLVAHGFSGQGSGPLARIVKAFQTAKVSRVDPSVPYLIIRDLALGLNNDRNDPETAFRLFDAVMRDGRAKIPNDVLRKFEEERAVTHKNWKMKEIETHSGDLKAMVRLLDEMARYATGPERAELARQKSKIERKLTARKVKWGIYAAIAGVIGFAVISEEFDRPSTGSSYSPPPANSTSYRPAPTTQTSSGTSTFSKPSTNAAPTPSTPTYKEVKPAAGTNRALSKSEVRYCVFQGKRLEYLRPSAISDYQIDQFNALIDDYNLRCSSYRYKVGDLQSVQREAVTRASQLRSDASRISSGWKPTPSQNTPSQPPTSAAPAAPTKPTTPPEPVFKRHANLDFRGLDLTDQGYRGVSVAECEAICARNSQCKAYSYVVSKRWCWPKYGVGKIVRGMSDLTSGERIQ